MSGISEFLSRYNQSLTRGLRPWSVFLDLTSLNLPSSIPDATTRISHNLTHFGYNYYVLLIILLYFSLVFRPLSFIAFTIVLLGWAFLYFFRDEPLRILGFEVNDWLVLGGLFTVTFVLLIWGGIWLNVLAAVGIGAVLLVLHAGLRSTDDLVMDDIQTSPYGNLLSDDDADPRGAYSGI